MTENTNNPEDNAEESRKPVDQFVDHQKKAFDETAKAIEALLPEGFVEHGKQATKEFVAGFKVLADAAIDELEKVAKRMEEKKSEGASDSGDDDKPSSTGKSKVKVEVD